MVAVVKEISPSVTNESKVRMIAFFVLILAVFYIFTTFILVPIFLVMDFALRSFDFGKYSPLAILSDSLVKSFKLPVKPVYFPPKRFAARVGFAFSIAIVLLHIMDSNVVIISSVLAFFAALESLAGICAGCYVFDFIQRFKKIK